MISKTIGFRGLAYFQTHPSDSSEKKSIASTLTFASSLCVQSSVSKSNRGCRHHEGKPLMGIKGIWHSLDPHDLQCMYILLEILFLRIQYTYTVHIRVDTSFLHHKNNLKYINLTSSNHLNMSGSTCPGLDTSTRLLGSQRSGRGGARWAVAWASPFSGNFTRKIGWKSWKIWEIHRNPL